MSLKRVSERYSAFVSVEKMSTCSEDATAKSCGATGENSIEDGAAALSLKMVGCLKSGFAVLAGRSRCARSIGSYDDIVHVRPASQRSVRAALLQNGRRQDCCRVGSSRPREAQDQQSLAGNHTQHARGMNFRLSHTVRRLSAAVQSREESQRANSMAARPET